MHCQGCNKEIPFHKVFKKCDDCVDEDNEYWDAVERFDYYDE